MLTNNLLTQVFVCCMDLLSALFHELLQPQEMGSIHPVLCGFTEIGQGARMCLATRHLGISDNKGQGMLIIINYEMLRLYFISVYDQTEKIILCTNLLIL